MKRIVALVLTIALLAANVLAVNLYVDGTKLEPDVPPTIINGRTLVPLRAIFEALGASVTWDDATQTATGVKDGTTVSVAINNTTAYVNDEAKTLDVPAQLINDRTMVPARFIAESFGADVGWDEATETVTITSGATPAPIAAPAAPVRTVVVRGIAFGDDAETVINTDTGTYIGTSENLIMFSDTVSGLDTSVVYEFNDSGLVCGIAYFLDEYHTTISNYIDDYNRLKKALIALFGEPYTDKINSTDTASIVDAGTALEFGYSEYATTWNMDGYYICLMMDADNYEIDTTVFFLPAERLSEVNTDGF